jgi:ABC-type sugar transport system substrate-binding protein
MGGSVVDRDSQTDERSGQGQGCGRLAGAAVAGLPGGRSVKAVNSGEGLGIAGAFFGLLVMVTGLAGCGSDSFAPPPPPELAAGAGVDTSSGQARLVEVVLAHPPIDDRRYIIQVMRQVAGRNKIAFRSSQPEEGEEASAARLASKIHEAVNQGADGLLVEPIDDPQVIQELDAARARGVAVLLLDRSLKGADGKLFPGIGFGSFEEAGKQLVEAAFEERDRFHYPADTPVVVMVKRMPDPDGPRRLQSLTRALKDAGQPFDLVEFEGGEAEAKTALGDYLKTHPKVGVVLAESDQGLTASYALILEREKANLPIFAAAGYIAYDIRTVHDGYKVYAAFVDRSIEPLARKALQSLAKMMDGETVPDWIEVKTEFHRKRAGFVPVGSPESVPASTSAPDSNRPVSPSESASDAGSEAKPEAEGAGSPDSARSEG